MKPEINLLSPEARGLRMALIAAHRVNKLLYAILGGLAVVLMVYGASWWANKIILSSLDNRLLQQGKERVEIEQSIRSLNSTVQAIDARITANPRWAIHIQDVLTVLPSGIQIMKLELSESQSVLLITTKAASGDVGVQYQHALEAVGWVDHVDAPLQNFARSPEAIATFTVFRKADNGGIL